jgi:hypothetical protein
LIVPERCPEFPFCIGHFFSEVFCVYKRRWL